MEVKKEIVAIRHVIENMRRRLIRLYKKAGPDECEMVINAAYGGFGVNDEIAEIYERRTGNTVRNREWWEHGFCERDNPDFVAAVKEAKNTKSRYSKLIVKTADRNHDWGIDEYDGLESINEGDYRLLNTSEEKKEFAEFLNLVKIGTYTDVDDEPDEAAEEEEDENEEDEEDE